MRKKISMFVFIIIILVNVSHASHIENVSDLKVEVYNKKNTMDENAFTYAYLQNTLSDSEELIRNYELLNLDGRDMAHFLNHVLDFADTTENVESKFKEEKFDESTDELHRLESLKNSTESKRTVLVSQGYNEYYVDDILKNMEKIIKLYGETICLDLIKKADDYNKLNEKVFFLNYAVQLCSEYKPEECEKLHKKHEDVNIEIKKWENEAKNCDEYGDSNLTAAKNTRIRFFSFRYYDKCIEHYYDAYTIYENVLGMRESDAVRLEGKIKDVKMEQSDVFQDVLKSYSINSLICIIAVVLGMRITRNYRREIRLNRIIKKFY